MAAVGGVDEDRIPLDDGGQLGLAPGFEIEQFAAGGRPHDPEGDGEDSREPRGSGGTGGLPTSDRAGAGALVD